MMPAAAMKKSGVITPTSLAWKKRLGARLVVALLRLSIKTWRRVWLDTAVYPESAGPVIFCVWHNRLPLALASYDASIRARWPADGLSAMISASRDGSFLSAVAEAFGVKPIRGSSSRRGPQALLEATTWMEKNYSIVITPDGPRGPMYHVHEGLILLAQLTGRPIIPASNYAAWKVRLRSWDRFQIPLPFSRCELRYAAPLWAPREADDSEREQLRLQLQQTMLSITRD
jgi:hypothetical protein